MEINKTVEIKISQEELVEFMASRVIELEEDETYEIVKEYPVLGEYTFRIIKEEEDVNEDEK